MAERLNAQERAGFAAYARGMEEWLGRNRRAYRYAWRQTPTEPALGTLDQRLSILIKRLGGRLTVPKPTAEELATVESWTVEAEQEVLL